MSPTEDIRFIQGNEACAEGALAAGCRFFAGYPITPSSEIAEHLALELPLRDGVFIQMEDEIAAMGAVIGASLAGAKSLTATSGPGFSLKQENIGFACMAQIPCVIVDVMRGGPSTGLPTMASQSDIQQARWGTHGDHPIVALCPATVSECFSMTVRAFNLAEQLRNPVILLLDEIIGHLREKIRIPPAGEIEIIDRVKPTGPPAEYLPFELVEGDIPPLAAYGDGYRFHVTGLAHDESGFPTNDPAKIEPMMRRLLRKVVRNADAIIEYEELLTGDAEILVVAAGSTSRSAKTAVKMARERGIKVGIFRPKTIWPWPTRALGEVGERMKHLIVPELSLGQLAREVGRCVRAHVPVHRVNLVSGEPIPPSMILAKIEEVA